MRFKEVFSSKDFRKIYTSLLLLLPFLAIAGIVFCLFYTHPFDGDDLLDISLHNSGISYQIFNQEIFLPTPLQPISVTQVCINALFTRAPPRSILF